MRKGYTLIKSQGYHPPSVARCWLNVLAELCDDDLPESIPEFFDSQLQPSSSSSPSFFSASIESSVESSYIEFSPTFSPSTEFRKSMVDQNSREYLIELIGKIQTYSQQAAEYEALKKRKYACLI
jgi:hypothetical protein